MNYDRQMQDQTYWSALLAASDGAAFVIDVAEGRFVAANAAADALWGAASLQGMRADSAMPAFARLREQAELHQGRPVDFSEEWRETLVFWTQRGARRLAARYRRLSSHSPIYMVEVRDRTEVAEARPVGNVMAGPATSTIASPPTGVPGLEDGAGSHEGPTVSARAPSSSSSGQSAGSVFAERVAAEELQSAEFDPDPLPRQFSALARTRVNLAGADMERPSSATKPSPQDLAASSPSVQRTDAETLREIARRIRGGQHRFGPAIEREATPIGAVPGREDDQRRPNSSDTGPLHPSLNRRGTRAPGDSAQADMNPRRVVPTIAQPPSQPLTPGDTRADLGGKRPETRVGGTLSERRGESVDDRSLEPRAPDTLAPVNLARLAHELRTPISAIVAMSEIMRDERFGPIGDTRYVGYAGDIHDSARHLLDVISSMIDPVNGVRQMPRIEFAEVDLALAVERAVSAMRPLAERAHVSLELHIPDALPRVIADKRSVRQILLNLLSNALKATPQGGAIEVIAVYDAVDAHVRLDISDSGPGMSQAEILKVFRAPQDSSRHGVAPDANVPPASGYGLPLVRALAAANGAEFSLDSSPGEGLRARLLFPAQRLIHG